MFENQQINLENIPSYEHIPLHALDKEYKKIVVFDSIVVLVLGLALSILLFKMDSTKSVYTYFYFPVLISFIITSYLLLIYKRKAYAFRQHDVIFQTGIFIQSTHIVPYLRIQHIIVKQGFYAKRLGLATLKLHTAANDNIDISIPGLTLEDANRWKQYVMNRLDELDHAEAE